jgi:hypothetical protein
MLASIVEILPEAIIQRARILAGRARVLARKGQVVLANDILAEDILSASHLSFDVSRGLGITEQRAAEYIHCQVGQQISEKDILAGPLGLTRRVVRSPRDGIVVLISRGMILLELKSELRKLKAGMPGEVVELLPGQGAVIQGFGALVQGVWGNGLINSGPLLLKTSELGQELRPDVVKTAPPDAILVADLCQDVRALETAVQIPLAGLILGSLAPELIPAAQKLPFPVLVTEGFYGSGINSLAREIFHAHQNEFVSLNTQRSDHGAHMRPEAMIPLTRRSPGPSESVTINSPPIFVRKFTPGQHVRMLRPPYASQVGILVEVLGRIDLPNGLRSQAGLVRFENDDITTVPLVNLELLK